jgi:glycosyltransferase involved in cell wall biosynthesis
MKLIFINRFYYPDHSATSQLLTDLATDLAANGREVHVIASRQLYQSPGANLPANDIVGGVQIHRVWSTSFGRDFLPGRLVDYLTFYATVGVRLLSLLRKGDVVIAKTDPPLISVLAAACAEVTGARLVNWMQDVFPEIAQRLNVTLPRPVATSLIFLRNWSLRRAHLTVALGERMRDQLERAAGLDDGRLTVIHNWADAELISPIEFGGSPLRRDWGIENRFVVAYSGNMGRAHEFETIVSAIRELREETDVVFLFIGGGSRANWLRAQIERRQLTKQVIFVPYVERSRLSESLGAADVHLVSLNPELEGLIVPSKFYAIAAAGRPTLFVGDPDGEIGRIVARYECGYSIPVGEASTLTRRIRSLKASPDHCRRLGQAARTALLAKFDRKGAFELWQAAIRRVESHIALSR